jgi:hypothetical protein
LRVKPTTVRRFDESCHAGLDPASISLEGACVRHHGFRVKPAMTSI